MASLEQKIREFACDIRAKFNEVHGIIGTTSLLGTTDKTSIVGAINEVKQSVPVINDAAASTSTTYSANKIDSAIAAAKSEIIGGADNLHDTFKEIAAEITADKSGLAALTAQVGNRVRFDAPQSLTATQQAQALTNIGAVSLADIGNTDTDFVSVFRNGLL